MTADVMRHYQTRLREMVARLSDEVTTLRSEALRTAAADAGGAASDQADPGAMAGGEEVAMTLLGTEGDTLAEASAALDRIDQGTFGRCEGCHRPIGRDRLDAVPHARHCIRCARRNEVAKAAG